MATNEINENLSDALFGAAANWAESIISNLPDDTKLAIRYAISRGGRILITVGLSDGGAQLQAALQAETGQIFRLEHDVKTGDTMPGRTN